MGGQRYFEDVKVGEELTPLKKRPTTRQLVQWAGATEDYAEVHYDEEQARQKGFAHVIVHGRLKAAFLGQLVTDWMGACGRLKKFSCSFRATDFPGTEMLCLGKVVDKRIDGVDHVIDCELWIQNERQEKTTLGSATVALPFGSQLEERF